MVVIDTHAHVFSPEGTFAQEARCVPAYRAGLDEWFALQERAGVTHGVLVQPSFYGTDNSVLPAALAVHPQRLRGVVVKPGVVVKFSAPYRVEADVAALGPSRLMWGGDWPWTNFDARHDFASCRSWLDGWVPDDVQRALVLRDTPARLFRFP